MYLSVSAARAKAYLEHAQFEYAVALPALVESLCMQLFRALFREAFWPPFRSGIATFPFNPSYISHDAAF